MCHNQSIARNNLISLSLPEFVIPPSLEVTLSRPYLSRQILLLADKVFRKIVCGISLFIHIKQTPLCCMCNWVQFWFRYRTWTIIEKLYTLAWTFDVKCMSLPENSGYEHLLLYFLLSRGMNFRSRKYEANPESLYLLGNSNFIHATG